MSDEPDEGPAEVDPARWAGARLPNEVTGLFYWWVTIAGEYDPEELVNAALKEVGDSDTASPAGIERLASNLGEMLRFAVDAADELQDGDFVLADVGFGSDAESLKNKLFVEASKAMDVHSVAVAMLIKAGKLAETEE